MVSGRGGAGNWAAQHEAEQRAKKATEDLEAQELPSPVIESAAAQAGNPYTKAGRGGAGNFYDTATLPDKKEQEEAADKTMAAVTASLARPKMGTSGRGGAGNWQDNTADHDKKESVKREALEAKILEDVEAGLAMPPKTYRSHNREGPE